MRSVRGLRRLDADHAKLGLSWELPVNSPYRNDDMVSARLMSHTLLIKITCQPSMLCLIPNPFSHPVIRVCFAIEPCSDSGQNVRSTALRLYHHSRIGHPHHANLLFSLSIRFKLTHVASSMVIKAKHQNRPN